MRAAVKHVRRRYNAFFNFCFAEAVCACDESDQIQERLYRRTCPEVRLQRRQRIAQHYTASVAFPEIQKRMRPQLPALPQQVPDLLTGELRTWAP